MVACLELRAGDMAMTAAARLRLRAPVSTLAADATAAKPISTVADDAPTANVIWLQRVLSDLSSSHGAKLGDLHRKTLSMATELKRVEADHADSVSESKRAIVTTAWRICIVGGSFLLTIFTMLRSD